MEAWHVTFYQVSIDQQVSCENPHQLSQNMTASLDNVCSTLGLHINHSCFVGLVFTERALVAIEASSKGMTMLISSMPLKTRTAQEYSVVPLPVNREHNGSAGL